VRRNVAGYLSSGGWENFPVASYAVDGSCGSRVGSHPSSYPFFIVESVLLLSLPLHVDYGPRTRCNVVLTSSP